MTLSDMSPFDLSLWSPRAGFAVAQGLREAYAAVAERQNGPVVVETVIVDDVDVLPSLVQGSNWAAEAAQAGPARLGRFAHKRGDFVLSIWPTDHPRVFHLIGTVPTTDPRWEKVRRLIAKAAPRIVPCFLDDRDFIAIGSSLAAYGDVEVSRSTARRRSDLSSVTRGWKARIGSLRPNHLEAIDQAEWEGASVRSLTLHVRDRIDVHLRRVAGATFYAGDFSLFEEVFLRQFADAAARRYSLMADRQRRPGTNAIPRPVTIRLTADAFTDREATGQVLNELQRQPGLAVAVLHRNPYLHVAVTDYSDGSNFDVLITDPRTIEVFPGYRASLGSLTRVAQQLGDRFEAVEIGEADQRGTVSLADLVAG